MTLMQKNLNEETQNELNFNTNDLPNNSIYFLGTFYFYLFASIILFSLTFFFLSYTSEEAFNYFFVGFWVLISAVGIKNYDNISRIFLLVLSIFLGILLITMNFLFHYPILILYYPGLILTVYALVFDKNTIIKFKSNLNKKLLTLNIIIIFEYFYLFLDGYINLATFTKQPPEFLMIYYIFLFLVFVNVLFVQLKNANGRLLMFFTSIALISYSLLNILANPYRIIAIVISIAMIIDLLLDKKAISEFKVIDHETYYFFKTNYYVNIFALIIIIMGVLYLYSTEFILTNLLLGLGFALFFAFCLFKINRYSIIWKHIFSILNVGIFIISTFYFEQFISITIFLIPISFITVFCLNFEQQTKILFRKMNSDTIINL